MLTEHACGADVKKRLIKKWIALAGLVVIITIPVILVTYLHNSVDVTPLRIGTRIPLIGLTNLAGKPTTTRSLRDNATVVLVFSARCPHCISMLSEFNRMKLKYEDALRFVGISVSKPDTTEALVAASGVSFPVYIGNDAEIEKAFRITFVPVTLFVDSNLILRKEVVGEVKSGILDRSIESFTEHKVDLEMGATKYPTRSYLR